MTPLRAYVFRGAQEEWTCSTFRDWEPLDQFLRDCIREGCTAVVHVGFSRPTTSSIAAACEQYRGRLFFTGAAREAAPAGSELNCSQIADVGGLSLWLILKGYGYEVAEQAAASELPAHASASALPARASEVTPVIDEANLAWVTEAVQNDPELAKAFESLGITSDRSYRTRESGLTRDLRFRAGIARFRYLSHGDLVADRVLHHLHCLPPWTWDLDLGALNLSVRLRHVLAAASIQTIRDLATIGFNKLMRLPNLGRGSAHLLGQLICDSLLFGTALPTTAAPDVEAPDDIRMLSGSSDTSLTVKADEMTGPLSFVEHLNAFEATLNDNQRQIWRGRAGIGEPRKTLHELAQQLSVTRERIRQIETRIVKRLRREPFVGELSTRIETLLRGRQTPLLAHGLGSLDPWLGGSESFTETIAFLSRQVLDGPISIYDVGGLPVVTTLASVKFEAARRAAVATLRTSQGLTKEEARTLVDALLIGDGEELREDLWRAASAGAIWTDGAGGRLVGFSRTAETLVEAILRSAGEPLHFSQIAARAEQLVGQAYSRGRIHNAAAEVGYLFARGTYGLQEHCPLSASNLRLLTSEVEDVIASGDPERQWHSSELCDELLARGLNFDGHLTKYVLNFALRESSDLAYLGRMTWRRRGTWVGAGRERVDITQAVISILEDAGGPLPSDEIRARMESSRGVNDHFQIFGTDYLVRVGPGVWGLVGRDVFLEDARPLLLSLRKELEMRGSGLHVSEIARHFGMASETLDPILGLLSQEGLRLDRGQYVYVSAWGESRRRSIPEAVRDILARAGEVGLTFRDLAEGTAKDIGREVDPQHLSSVLQSVGAEWSPLDSRWRFEAGEEEQEAVESRSVEEEGA